MSEQTNPTPPTNQRDPEKDSLTIRIEVFKHASTIASALAAIFATFLLINLKEAPPALWLLIISILFFLFVSGFSVFALSNLASHIRSGEYQLTGETSFALNLTYIPFFLGFVFSIIFILINVFSYAKEAPGVEEHVKTYVSGYVDSTVKNLIQNDLKNEIDKELKRFSARIDDKIDKDIEIQDKAIRKYINEKLNEKTVSQP